MEPLYQEVGTSIQTFQGCANDSTARVWKNWECVYTLKGHERAVWAVLALQNDEYLTGFAFQTV
jgi:phospholipase A-2-activating protein